MGDGQAVRADKRSFRGDAFARLAGMNKLYRTLSPKGNPALSSFSAILKAMGMRLAVRPLTPSPTA